MLRCGIGRFQAEIARTKGGMAANAPFKQTQLNYTPISNPAAIEPARGKRYSWSLRVGPSAGRGQNLCAAVSRSLLDAVSPGTTRPSPSFDRPLKGISILMSRRPPKANASLLGVSAGTLELADGGLLPKSGERLQSANIPEFAAHWYELPMERVHFSGLRYAPKC
jgi:hypothetical protein